MTVLYRLKLSFMGIYWNVATTAAIVYVVYKVMRLLVSFERTSSNQLDINIHERERETNPLPLRLLQTLSLNIL